MGHSQADKARSHERIVQIASRRFRECGLEGVGLAKLMKEAGLTVGGFYKHFGSRDDLVAEAVAMAFDGSRAKIAQKPTFAKLVDDYLSPAHRDDPGAGCAFSALTADLARSGTKIRSAATEEIRRNFERIAGLLKEQKAETRRGEAIFVFSALVGALGLSRVVNDDKLSCEILQTVAGRLKSMSKE